MAYLGIDLGTTNSACAVWSDGKARLIPNRLGKFLTPSVVGLDENGALLVGDTARQRLYSHPRYTVGAFKRIMGTAHTVSLDSRDFNATELSSLVIRSLKEDAEHCLGNPVKTAIISVPAYFNNQQREATREAGELAGLTVNRLINEPTAAAIAHGLGQKSDGKFAVLDLGGGTFDVSILEYFDGIMEVHASAGDNLLGGEDFVEALMRTFAADHDLSLSGMEANDKQLIHSRMETAKRLLTSEKAAEIEIEIKGHNLKWKIDAERFREICSPLLLRIQAPIRQALYDAGLDVDGLDDVVIVGGATRMPIFRSMVAKLLMRFPRADADPDLTIALGAGVQAGLVEKDKALDDVVLIDVCPYSLGVATVSSDHSSAAQVFTPIIERNTTIPASFVETFHTVSDKQKEIAVEIFQGESRWVDKNIFLGSINVSVPKKLAGEETVDVRFSYDVNGLLDVDVTVNSTGLKMKRVIEQKPGALSKEQKEKSLKRLETLKQHPRDKEENKVVLARADRIYQQLRGADRNQLAAAMDVFQRTLFGQKINEIERLRKELTDFLDQIDRDMWI